MGRPIESISGFRQRGQEWAQPCDDVLFSKGGRLADLTWVVLYDDLVCIAANGGPVVADQVKIEAGADEQDQVGVLDGDVASTRTEDPPAAGIVRMARRQCILRARDDDRTAQPLDQAVELVDRIRLSYSGTHHEQRPSRGAPPLEHALGMRREIRRCMCARAERRQLVWLDLHRLHIRRDIQPSRARPAGRGQMERLLQLVTNPRGVVDAPDVLRDWGCDADRVHFLLAQLTHLWKKAVAGTQELSLGLPRNDDHRQRIDVSAEDAGHGIDRPRSCGHLHEGGTTSYSRVPLCGNGSCLLVVAADLAHASFSRQGIVQMHGCATGDQKSRIDGAVSKKADDIVCQSHYCLQA